MVNFIIKRLLIMIPILVVISIISFTLIQLPPGDFLTTYMMQMQEHGGALTPADRERLDAMRTRYGLDRPVHEQYLMWMGNIIRRGDFGRSFHHDRPVTDIITSRFGYELLVVGSAIAFMFVIAFPVGFYSAVKQYTLGDYVFTFFGFLGLSIPNFFLALLLLFLFYQAFGEALGGLFSAQYADAPWSVGRVLDLLSHLWVPMVVVGTHGTAGQIRILRNNLLDELQRPYVMTARAKGLNELELLFKYPVRLAINPFLSTVGWLIPDIFSASLITGVVLTLPTIGPAFLTALLAQDMYLAGSIVLLLAVFTLVGTIISDILLALADPRIRYE